MVLIHEKITALLEQRRLKKRDLARALGVSPQTATDICKGRSAITLPHLRNLISFFGIRSEFWLDDERLAPEEFDRLERRGTATALARSGVLDLDDPERLFARLREFVQAHRNEFLEAFPDLSPSEQRLLGMGGSMEGGSIGTIGAHDARSPQPDARPRGSLPAGGGITGGGITGGMPTPASHPSSPTPGGEGHHSGARESDA